MECCGKESAHNDILEVELRYYLDPRPITRWTTRLRMVSVYRDEENLALKEVH